MKFGKFIFLSLSGIFVVFIAVLMFKTTRAMAASVDTSISVDILPQNPAPGEDTTVTLSTYENDLNRVLIKWFINGKSASSGVGKKSLSLKAPTTGSTATVTAIVSLPSGNVETKAIVRSSVMVLLWQADDSYVPPFYKGKAMPSPESEVKVVAMPEVKSGSSYVDPRNMVYAWQQDYTNNQDGSGYGKNFFLYTTDYLEDSNTISVTASTTDQQYSSDASVNIGMTQPKILFYKNDSKIGTVWENALTDPHRINGSEVIDAEPYFISPKEIANPRLLWNWFINDSLVTPLDFRKNLMPVRAQNGVSGTSTLRLEITNQDKIFETASKTINIEF